MAGYKVTYFDIAGSRGEEVRLALTIAGLAFEDIRLNREAFADIKADLPFGSVPILEVEGKGVFAQSNAILRLIGRQNGLYPEDPYEAARQDVLMGAVEDLRHKISPSMRMQDAAERQAARQVLAQHTIPAWAAGIERLLGNTRYSGGEQLYVADIKIFMVNRWLSSGVLEHIPTTVFEAFPKFNAVAMAVQAHPAVAGWYADTSESSA